MLMIYLKTFYFGALRGAVCGNFGLCKNWGRCMFIVGGVGMDMVGNYK